MTPSHRTDVSTVDGLSVVRRTARSRPAGEAGSAAASGPSASPFGGADDPDPTSGATVLFVHGAMDRAASFGRVMRRLSHLDTLAVDRRGYGASTGAGVAESLEEHVTDLRAVIEWSEAERIVVVGHSLGGRLALELATQADPRVIAVATFEAPLPELDDSRDRIGGGAIEAGRAEGPEAAAEHFYRRMVGEGTWTRLRQRDRDARRAEGPALLAELVDLRDGSPLDLDAIDLPVVVGVGERSGDGLRAGSHVLQDHLRDARFVEIAGAGHGAHLTHPDEFARYVLTAVHLGAGNQNAGNQNAGSRNEDVHDAGPGANPFAVEGGSHTGPSAR